MVPESAGPGRDRTKPFVDYIARGSDGNIPPCRLLTASGALVHTGRNRINAKFSPGALVDVEYFVQAL